MSLIKCNNCGNEVNLNTKFCPNCGNNIIVNSNSSNKLNILALNGFIISLLSLLFIIFIVLIFTGIFSSLVLLSPLLFIIFPILGIIGLILAICGLISIKKNNENGKGFAISALIMSSISLIALTIYIATPTTLGIINDQDSSESERGAELIITSIELAYSTAYLFNDGEFPSISEVAQVFDMDAVSMSNDGTIYTYDKNIDCTTSTSNNTLKVSCKANGKTIETKNTMELR